MIYAKLNRLGTLLFNLKQYNSVEQFVTTRFSLITDLHTEVSEASTTNSPISLMPIAYQRQLVSFLNLKLPDMFKTNRV